MTRKTTTLAYRQQVLNIDAPPKLARSLILREMPLTDQPIWRLLNLGPQALSNIELLTLLLDQENHDLATQLLLEFQGWNGLLRAESDLLGAGGLTEEQAARVLAALEISRRRLLEEPEQWVQISAPADVVALLMAEMGHLDHEQLRVVCLNTKNCVVRIATVTVGSVNAAAVRVSEVFKPAVRLNCPAIILCHNHPSSDPGPSADDVLVTRSIVQAGELLEIQVLDHIIIGGSSWISMRERRLGWS